jgi:hypothetical protein
MSMSGGGSATTTRGIVGPSRDRPARGRASDRLPAPGQEARDHEERRRHGRQDGELRPERPQGLVQVEHLAVAVEGPAVERGEAGLLHRRGHHEPREHAPADGGHDQDHDRREPAKLPLAAAGGAEHEAEGRRGGA